MKIISFLLIIFLFSFQAYAAVAKDIRISDNDGDVLNINSDGSISAS